MGHVSDQRATDSKSGEHPQDIGGNWGMFVIGGRWFQGQENVLRVLGITGACLCLMRDDFKVGRTSSGYSGKWGVFVIGARRFLGREKVIRVVGCYRQVWEMR